MYNYYFECNENQKCKGKKFAVLLFMVSVLGFADENADYTNNSLTVERPRVALVLGGGGGKGSAHIIVLEVIEELEIPVDIIIGSSAGSVVGGLYSVGYSPEMILEVLFGLDMSSFFLDSLVSPFERELGTDNLFPLYNSTMQNPSVGLFRGNAAYTLFKTLTAKIPSYIDFDTLPIPFRAVALEIPEGKPVLLREGDIAEAIRASMSIPGIFDIFNIDGTQYMDGGVVDNLAIRRAKELGYDIIIASELTPRPNNFNPSILEIPEMLMLNLYFSTVSEEQYHLANVVLKFDLNNYSFMNFQKSEEIHFLARNERETIRAELEKIKALLSPPPEGISFSPELSTRQLYTELPDLVPEDIIITGALQRDRAYIERTFARYIKGKPLERDNTKTFMQEVYKTGNYRFIWFRPHIRQEKTVLELNFYPVKSDYTVFLMGGNYRGIKGISSSDLFSNLNLQGNVQFHGLSGPGSVLSLEVSTFGTYSLGVQYLQPLTPFSFLSTRWEIVSDSDIIPLGVTGLAWEEKKLFINSGELKGGIFLDRHLIKGGPLFYFSLGDFAEKIQSKSAAMGLGLSYAYDSLDYPFMPSKGVSVMLENRLYFPLPSPGPESSEFGRFFNMISLDTEAALPLGRGFSLTAGAFAGTNIGSGPPSEFFRLGFNVFDQHYFPNVSVTDDFRPRKVAASLALQLQPWKNLFAKWGQLVFSLSSTAGQVFNEWEDFALENLIWTVSLNAGLRIKNNYGILFRAGAGNNGSSPLSPFIAFDIGRQKSF
jgi:NTE family protein